KRCVALGRSGKSGGTLRGVGNAGVSGSDQVGRMGRRSGVEGFCGSVIAEGRGNVLGDCHSPCRQSEDRMSQQTIKQRARRTARESAERRRRERGGRERRVVGLAERVMVAIGERDAAVAETEKRAGGALRELTEREGLSLG